MHGANVAFRFAVVQPDKTRACDDLKYGLVNRCCTTDTPIKLPTWDHIGKLCLRIRHTDRPWGFPKADHRAAYKNLPIKPDHAKLCLAAIRCTTGLRWYVFLPRALLFGALAAVLRYNISSRIVALIMTSLFGLPVVIYFDDVGCPMLDSLARRGLRIFRAVIHQVGVIMENGKRPRAVMLYS